MAAYRALMRFIGFVLIVGFPLASIATTLAAARERQDAQILWVNLPVPLLILGAFSVRLARTRSIRYVRVSPCRPRQKIKLKKRY